MTLIPVVSKSAHQGTCQDCGRKITFAMTPGNRWLVFEGDPAGVKMTKDPDTGTMIDHFDSSDLHDCPQRERR